MDPIYRDRVLAVMRAEVEKIPAGEVGGVATISYRLWDDSFFSDVEIAVGYEYCFAMVYEDKVLANGQTLTTRYGTAEVHIAEDEEVEDAEAFITRIED